MKKTVDQVRNALQDSLNDEFCRLWKLSANPVVELNKKVPSDFEKLEIDLPPGPQLVVQNFYVEDGRGIVDVAHGLETFEFDLIRPSLGEEIVIRMIAVPLGNFSRKKYLTRLDGFASGKTGADATMVARYEITLVRSRF